MSPVRFLVTPHEKKRPKSLFFCYSQPFDLRLSTLGSRHSDVSPPPFHRNLFSFSTRCICRSDPSKSSDFIELNFQKCRFHRGFAGFCDCKDFSVSHLPPRNYNTSYTSYVVVNLPRKVNLFRKRPSLLPPSVITVIGFSEFFLPRDMGDAFFFSF